MVTLYQQGNNVTESKPSAEQAERRGKMTDKNENNLSLGENATTMTAERKIGNPVLQRLLDENKAPMSFGNKKDGDNIRYMDFPVTSLGMVV